MTLKVEYIRTPIAKRATFFSLMICLCNMIAAQSTVSGYIYDENAQPYNGAHVILQGKGGVVSDKSGRFSFEDVKLGSYELNITAVGYKDESVSGILSNPTEEVLVILTPNVNDIEEITITSDVAGEVRKTESLSIQTVSKRFLRESAESNLMQTLKKIPGVNTMDVGTGISKPVIRGLGHYRVVFAKNGIKQEGQQWSNHQGISIDQHAVENVEVIKGPASLEYGSDAIGGVINTLPSNVPNVQGVSGEVNLEAKSNTEWLGASADLSWRANDFYSEAHITYNTFGDFIIPETESFLLPSPGSAAEASHKVVLGNQLYNTAGKEQAASITAGVVKDWGKSYFELSYHGTKIGFFDWQGLKNKDTRVRHEASRRDQLLPYQVVDDYTINNYTKRYFGDDYLQLSLGYQVNHTKEHGGLSDRTGNRRADLQKYRAKNNLELDLLQHTMSANAHYFKKIDKIHELKVGLNAQSQLNEKDGYNHILPRYRRHAAGLFVTHRYTPSDRWIINSGVRADVTYLDMDKSTNPDPDYGQAIFNEALKKTYPGTAFSLGINYLPTDRTILKLNVGKSFRVPSAYELGAYGLHRHGGRFEQGDLNNKPEQAWQLDVAVEQKWNRLNVQLSPFVNYFTNYLYLTPTPILRLEGQVFEYQQTKAILWGGEANINYAITNKLNVQTGAEYVYAVNLDLNRSLPFTPPLSIKTELSYLLDDTNKFSETKISAELVTVGAQNNTVPNELSTPGYNSINLTATTEVDWGKQKIHLMLKVSNLLNSTYYNHTSFYRRLRIPEPGRDIQLFLGIPINEN